MTGKKIRKSFSRFSLSGLLSSSDTNIPKTSNPSSASTSSTLIPIRHFPSPPPLAPGDIPTHTLGHKVSPEEVRELHELIRRRCELDVWIWGKRKCYPTDRWKVKKEMDRSDAALSKIISLVQSWDTEDAWDLKEDWGKLREIRRKLEEGGKRYWAAHPPWEEELDASGPGGEGWNSQAGQQTYMGNERLALQVGQSQTYLGNERLASQVGQSQTYLGNERLASQVGQSQTYLPYRG
jgi:hypothetical protein